MIARFQLLMQKPWFPVAILIVLIFGVYSQTLSFDYIQLDEDDHIVNRQYFLSSWRVIPEAFQHDTYYPNGTSQFYRPLHTLTFVIDVIAGIRPWFSHLINITLHLGVSLLIFWFFREMGMSRTKALAFTLIFALHPISSRIVGWVPGRNDATFALFAVGSFIAFLKFLAKPRQWILGLHLFLFVAALMSKELGIVLPLLYGLWYWRNTPRAFSKEQLVIFLSSWLVLGGLWIVARTQALHDVPTTSWSTLLQGIIDHLVAIPFYLRLVIIPFHPLVMPTIQNALHWTSWLALGLLVSGVLVLWRRRLLNLSLALFGFVWFLFFLLPSLVGYESSVRPVLFEHRAYVPLIGILILTASVSWESVFSKLRHRAVLLTIIVLLALTVQTIRGSRDFKNGLTFWTRAVQQSPQYAGVHKGLGVVYANAGRHEEAVQEFQRTLELHPSEKRVHNNLGVIFLKQQRTFDAETEFLEEIKINPAYAIAHNNLGFTYATQKRFPEAERAWLTALAYDPWYALPHHGLAIIYAIVGNREQSLAHINTLLDIGASLPSDIQRIYDQYSQQ